MIHYAKIGNTEGPALMLVHGFPNDGNAWHTIAPVLATKFNLIIPDLPAAGNSEVPAGQLTMQMMAEALYHILEQEQLDKVVMAGHSMGGYAAMEFASRYPERLKGISLVHSLASADTEEKKDQRRKSVALMQKGKAELQMFLRGMSQNLFAEKFAREHPEALREVVENGMRQGASRLAALYTAIMNRQDHTGLLSQLTMPVQWIIGEEDNATPMRDALSQCSRSAISKVSVYNACGHMSFVEMPERLISDLVEFVAFCSNR
jgi:pimeloyl-ACP methyl ester carboxylesterase